MPNVPEPLRFVHWGLVQWLSRRTAEGRLRTVKSSRHRPGLNYLFFTDDLLIFSEANEDQLECIKEGLDQFCNCLGQRVNYLKSYMFISPNIPALEAERLSAKMRIPLRKKIEKYLGNIIVQDGKNRERHNEL